METNYIVSVPHDLKPACHALSERRFFEKDDANRSSLGVVCQLVSTVTLASGLRRALPGIMINALAKTRHTRENGYPGL